jgi:hypothetical protein
MKNSALILLIAFSSFVASAQDSSKSNPLSVSLRFSGVPVSNNVETDTSYQTALSVSPTLGLHKNGWGIVYSPSFVTSGQKQGIYMHAISVGYELDGKSNFEFETHYAHFFFTNNTSVPYSPLNNEIYLSTGYSGFWLEPVLETSFGFGNDSANAFSDDIGLSAGLSHDFDLQSKGIFSSIDITPAVKLNAGTNGFFAFLEVSKYISHSHNFTKYVKKDGRGKGSNLFELSNLEADIEAEFKKGSFSIHPSGGIFFPVYSGTDQTISGYAELSLQYSF